METLSSRIFLENIRIYAFHGVLPEENIIGTYYLVNLTVNANIWRATESDEIGDTLSYASLNELVHEEMAKPSRLLEHVAGRILRRLEEEYPEISSATVKITKSSPPMRGECSGASVEFSAKF